MVEHADAEQGGAGRIGMEQRLKMVGQVEKCGAGVEKQGWVRSKWV